MRLKNFLRTGAVNLFFQFVFILGIFLIGYNLTLSRGESLRYIELIAIILVPSIIWTIFFYFQDRLEPEPLSYLTLSFLAGMAGASFGVFPLSHIVFRVQEWMYASSTLFTLASFLVMAPLVSIVVYLVIRYFFLPLKEFNETVDGMIYGAIVGAGFAFIKSIHDIWPHSFYTMFVIAYIATTNVLIYSGVGSLMGYFIGKAKFRKQSTDISSSLGILIGIILLGVYYLLNEFIFLSGFEHAFWLSFFLTLIYSLAILLFCYFIMQKLTKTYIREKIQIIPKFDLLAVSIAVVFLIVASFLSFNGLQGEKYKNDKYGISFTYPRSFSQFPLSDTDILPAFIGEDSKIIFSGKNTLPKFSFIVEVHSAKFQDETPNYTKYIGSIKTESLIIKDTKIGGREGKRLAYSYLIHQKSLQHEFAQLQKVYKDIISFRNHVFIFTYRALSEDFDNGLPLYQKIMKSLKWKEK